MTARCLARNRWSMLALAGGALVFASCSSSPGSGQPRPATTTAQVGDDTPPSSLVDSQGRYTSVWDYLEDKYDVDADRRVSKAEYGRGEVAFARLDANRDGSIDAADFDVGVDGVGVMVAQMLLGLYLQDDGDPNTLRADEIEQAFGAYDEDFNALLTRAEFDALCAERVASGRPLEGAMAAEMEGGNAFDALTAAIDANTDAAIEFDELMAFHGRYLSDGALPQMYAKEPRSARPQAQAAEGELAPDFTLEPYHDGEAVSLSSFRGQKPVALIFGSYT